MEDTFIENATGKAIAFTGLLQDGADSDVIVDKGAVTRVLFIEH
jgi:hypothetical protein